MFVCVRACIYVCIHFKCICVSMHPHPFRLFLSRALSDSHDW